MRKDTLYIYIYMRSNIYAKQTQMNEAQALDPHHETCSTRSSLTDLTNISGKLASRALPKADPMSQHDWKYFMFLR